MYWNLIGYWVEVGRSSHFDSIIDGCSSKLLWCNALDLCEVFWDVYGELAWSGKNISVERILCMSRFVTKKLDN